MDLLFDSTVYVIAAIRKDDDNKCGKKPYASLTFVTSCAKLLLRWSNTHKDNQK